MASLSETFAAPGPTPEFQRGTGPDALPYGEATQLNQAMPAPGPAPQVQPSGPSSSPAPQVQGQAPQAPAQPFKPRNELDQFLTDYNGPYTPPMAPHLGPLPAGAADWLPILDAAAESPDSSPELLQARTDIATRIRANQ